MNPRNYMGHLTYTTTTPPRPIVYKCGCITYSAAKHLASTLIHLEGKTGHSIRNTNELVDKLRRLEISPVRKLLSHDVTALFSSVSVDKALEDITERLQEDDTLISLTEMTIPQIVDLPDFCLNTTYFIPYVACYQHTHGAAMGSSISPLVANC